MYNEVGTYLKPFDKLRIINTNLALEMLRQGIYIFYLYFIYLKIQIHKKIRCYHAYCNTKIPSLHHIIRYYKDSDI